MNDNQDKQIKLSDIEGYSNLKHNEIRQIRNDNER